MTALALAEEWRPTTVDRETGSRLALDDAAFVALMQAPAPPGEHRPMNDDALARLADPRASCPDRCEEAGL